MGDTSACVAAATAPHAALRQGLRNGALGAFGMGLATALATIPPIIAVSFDPAASDNHVAAVVRDINEKKERAVRHASSAAGQQRVKTRQTALQRVLAPVRSMRRMVSSASMALSEVSAAASRSAPRRARPVAELSVSEEMSTTAGQPHAAV